MTTGKTSGEKTKLKDVWGWWRRRVGFQGPSLGYLLREDFAFLGTWNVAS